MEMAALEADMTQSDWEVLADIIVTALTISNEGILSETRRLTAEWQDKPEGLTWEDGLGQKEGRIWIPESEELWRKILGLYHDSLVTGHLGLLSTLELVARSYWRHDMTDWIKQYVQGCHTCHQAKHRN